MKSAPSAVPRSMSHWVDPFIIVAIILFVYIALRTSQVSDFFLAILIVISISVVMGTIEFFRAPWSPMSGHSFGAHSRPWREVLREAGLQWLGLIVYFGIVCLAWWLLAEYHRSYYGKFFALIPYILLYGPVLTFVFLVLAEKWLGSALRGGREMGLLTARVVRGRVHEAFQTARWHFIRDEMLSWVLWGFFLPLNFVELVKTISTIRGYEYIVLGDDWAKAQYFLMMMIYGLLIASITPGYLFASRLIRTQTKAVDHSWFGWAITLICYDPLVSGVFDRWFDYRVAVTGMVWMRPWTTTLAGSHALLIWVGSLILFCELVHLWGEAQFGLRSSNISNRGVITAGPYRLTKHPVYVSKLAGWILIWVPFLAGGTPLEDIRLTLLWVGVCIIYALRAVAEERLLSHDPDYVTYALYMDEHGMFAWVGRLAPIMKFGYRYERWWKQEVTLNTSSVPATV